MLMLRTYNYAQNYASIFYSGLVVAAVLVVVVMSVLILYNFDGIIHTFKVQRQSRTLPYLSKNFVGRENELQDMIKTMNFSSDEVRVLNIIGPPGFGKSTLAIHLGHKLIDLGVGVHYINMAEYVKRNIQLVLAEKILTSSKKITKFDKLLNWVGEREGDEVVLILDNCDEVLNSAKKESPPQQYHKDYSSL